MQTWQSKVEESLLKVRSDLKQLKSKNGIKSAVKNLKI